MSLNLTVLIVIASTRPEWPATSTISPIVICPSKIINKPVIISLTKVCAPKPTAKPTTPAAAINGPIKQAL